MQFPYVLLLTKLNGTFPYGHGYKDVLEADLVALLKLSRETV